MEVIKEEEHVFTIQYRDRFVKVTLSEEQLNKALMTEKTLQRDQAKFMIDHLGDITFKATDVFTEKELALKTLKSTEDSWNKRIWYKEVKPLAAQKNHRGTQTDSDAAYKRLKEVARQILEVLDAQEEK